MRRSCLIVYRPRPDRRIDVLTRLRRVALCLAVWVFASAVRADVVISGIDGELFNNVRAYIGLTDASCELGDGAVAAAAERIPRDAVKALEALGYYNPTVTVAQSRVPECWQLNVTVRAGQPARYLEVDVRVEGPAAADEAVRGAIAAAPLPGDVVHHGRYSAYKRRLAQVLADRGYLTAERTTAAVRVDQAGVSAALELAYQSGPRYRLGDIRVTSDAYDEALVQRFITLAPGMPFDSAVLARTQRELASSALFAEASVRAVYAEADAGTVPVAIELTAVERLGYFVGAGASTDRGPRLRGGYRNRRVNDHGHQFELDVLASQGLSRFGARYKTPLANPLREWQTIELTAEREDTETSESEGFRLGIERTRALGDQWLLRYGVRAEQTEFSVSSEENEATLLVPILSASFRDVDREERPRSGRSAELSLRFAADDWLSTTRFAQLYLRYRQRFPLTARSQLTLQTELGWLSAEEFDELPPAFRFFAGGDTSLRGFAFESLGPEDSLGVVIGGERLATASVEFERDIGETWGAAVFVDAGNAFADQFDDVRRAAGLGIVWHSPVGALRIYLAQDLEGEQSPRLHVRLGSTL